MVPIVSLLPLFALCIFPSGEERTSSPLSYTPPLLLTEEWYVQDQSSGKVTPGSCRPSEM